MTSMKREGKLRVLAALEMVTIPSSRGCRRTSRTCFLNSGDSSRKSTPLWARETSPGLGVFPPPISPASDMVWCGALNGLMDKNGLPFLSIPMTLYILVVSRASSKVRSGKIVGSLLAIMVFPDPGGPFMSMLWPPAAAISIALFTCS